MKLRTTIITSLVTIALAVLGLAPHALAAGSASYSVSLSSGAIQTGDTVSVSLYENSAETVNSVEGDITYDQTKLQFIGVSLGAFTTCPVAPSGGAGAVMVGCANFSGVAAGSQLVATVSFKALVAGSGSVSVAGSSLIASATTNQDIWNHVASSASVAITDPVTAPVTPPAGTGGSTQTGTTSGQASGNTSANNSGTQTASNTTQTSQTPTSSATAPKVTKNGNVLGTKNEIKNVSKKRRWFFGGTSGTNPLLPLGFIAVLVGLAVYLQRRFKIVTLRTKSQPVVVAATAKTTKTTTKKVTKKKLASKKKPNSKATVKK